MVEGGAIRKGRTQVGEVRRPFAAVSEITKSNQIAFFCQGEDWLIDRSDPLAEEIVRLVQRVKRKTKVYEHKGTYRLRAWMIPGKEEAHDDGKTSKVAAPTFGRLGP